MDKIKNAIQKLGYPTGDRYDRPSSTQTFPDGAHYRIEISGVERLANLEAMVDESEKRGVPVHRLIAMVGGPAQVPFHRVFKPKQVLNMPGLIQAKVLSEQVKRLSIGVRRQQ